MMHKRKLAHRRKMCDGRLADWSTTVTQTATVQYTSRSAFVVKGVSKIKVKPIVTRETDIITLLYSLVSGINNHCEDSSRAI